MSFNPNDANRNWGYMVRVSHGPINLPPTVNHWVAAGASAYGILVYLKDNLDLQLFKLMIGDVPYVVYKHNRLDLRWDKIK